MHVKRESHHDGGKRCQTIMEYIRIKTVCERLVLSQGGGGGG